MNVPPTAISSPNFQFLADHDSLLVTVVAAAERYAFDDPVTALMRLRQFAELLAKRAASQHGLKVIGCEFSKVLSLLREQRIVPKSVFELFDVLRLRGNAASHEGTGDRQTALRALISAREISLWFHRTFANPKFNGGPFRPPPNPAGVTDGLRKELEELRDEATEIRRQLEESQGRTREVEQIRRELAQEAEERYARLAQAEKLLIASEEARRTQQLEFERRLVELCARAREKPPEQLRIYLERSQHAARLHRLRPGEANYAWLTHLRIASPRQCCGVNMLIVQTSKWGWVKAACSLCGKEETLGSAEFCDLDVWVACPRCERRMQPAQIGFYHWYAYRCSDCGTTCLLANLVPSA